MTKSEEELQHEAWAQAQYAFLSGVRKMLPTRHTPAKYWWEDEEDLPGVIHALSRRVSFTVTRNAGRK